MLKDKCTSIPNGTEKFESIATNSKDLLEVSCKIKQKKKSLQISGRHNRMFENPQKTWGVAKHL